MTFSFFKNLGVTGLDLCEPGLGCVPRMMVGLVKIHHKTNANDKTLMFSDFEAAIKAAPVAPVAPVVAPVASFGIPV